MAARKFGPGQALGIMIVATTAFCFPVIAKEQDHYAGTILYPNPTTSQFGYRAYWAKTPTDAEIRSHLSTSVTVEGRTNWACHVYANGHIHDCRMQVAWPSNPNYERAAREVLNDFVLSEASSRAAQTNNAQVVFDIYFWGDGLKPPPAKECPPPFCTPVPPPPVPRS